MISNIKAKKHKGINEIEMRNLGHINIICGKNNSGKTSIFEALTTENKYALGILLNNEDILNKYFIPFARGYSAPNPGDLIDWFQNYLVKQNGLNRTWYYDELDGIISELHNAYYTNSGRLYSIQFNAMVESCFREINKLYKPIYIPPKRNLEASVELLFAQSILPNGKGITNRLFFLKNQDLDSNEMKKYQQIYKAFIDITGYTFNIIPQAGNNNLITIYFRQINKKDWISADSCGMGLAEALVIVAMSIDSEYNFLLVEEPESHLHPEMQRRLLNFIAGVKDKQFIFSTHSNIFLNPNMANRVFYTEIVEGNVKISDETSKSMILQGLGYETVDNLVSDVIVLTEGPYDIPVLSTICQWQGLLPKYNVKFWPIGGDIMSTLDLTAISDRKNVIALIDNDPGSDKARRLFMENCKENSIFCQRLKKYSIENYFSLESLKKVYGAQIDASITTLDPDKKLEAQIGLNVKKKNYNIIKNMTLDELKSTDLYEFILRIESLCKSGLGSDLHRA